MKLLSATVFALSSFALVSPAPAMGLVEAVLQCGNTPGCKATPNDTGGVLIEGPNGGVVECTSPQTDCFVLTHGRVSHGGKPRAAVPAMTSLSSSSSSAGEVGGPGGTFTVMGTIHSSSPVPIQ